MGDLAAGAECLLAVTEEGGIYCFGAADAPASARPVPDPRLVAAHPPASDPSTTAPSTTSPSTTRPASSDPLVERIAAGAAGQVKRIRADCHEDAGWTVGLGASSLPLVREIVRQSHMNCVIFEPSQQVAGELRRTLSREGLYGVRVSVLVGDITTIPFPAYFAALVVGAPPVPMNGRGR